MEKTRSCNFFVSPWPLLVIDLYPVITYTPLNSMHLIITTPLWLLGNGRWTYIRTKNAHTCTHTFPIILWWALQDLQPWSPTDKKLILHVTRHLARTQFGHMYIFNFPNVNSAYTLTPCIQLTHPKINSKAPSLVPRLRGYEAPPLPNLAWGVLCALAAGFWRYICLVVWHSSVVLCKLWSTGRAMCYLPQT